MRAANNKQQQAPRISKKVPGRPFPKGVSGNPSGRPKSNLSSLLAQYGRERDKKSSDKRPREERLVDDIWTSALNGDESCRNLIWERIDGKVKQSLGLENSDGAPARFTLTLGDGARDE